MAQAKRILLAFDMATRPPGDHNYKSYIHHPDWDTEFYINKALTNMGHEVILRGFYDDFADLVHQVQEIQPDLIFNMVQTFHNDRECEAVIAGVFDLLKVPYTGESPLSLRLCQDKILAKKILNHHRIRVPEWITSPLKKPVRSLKHFKYPAFVKAASTEGSEGISKDSLVENEKDCLERVQYLHDKFQSDVIIEEYIPGRELYVSVLGGKRKRVLPIRELKFVKLPEDEPRFATYKVKWDEKYRKKWGIRNQFARGIDDKTTRKIERIAKRAFELLKLRSYARFDMRLTDDGEVVLLEANPNPALATYDDFPQSAIKAGLSYEKLLQKIMDLA